MINECKFYRLSDSKKELVKCPIDGNIATRAVIINDTEVILRCDDCLNSVLRPSEPKVDKTIYSLKPNVKLSYLCKQCGSKTKVSQVTKVKDVKVYKHSKGFYAKAICLGCGNNLSVFTGADNVAL